MTVPSKDDTIIIEESQQSFDPATQATVISQAITVDESQPQNPSQSEPVSILTGFRGQNIDAEKAVEIWKQETWAKPQNKEQQSKLNIALSNIYEGQADLCRPPPTQETLAVRRTILEYKGEHKQDVIIMAAKIEEIVQKETRNNYTLKMAVLLEERTRRMFEESEIGPKEMNKFLEEINAHTKQTRTKTELNAFLGLQKLMDAGSREEIQREK